MKKQKLIAVVGPTASGKTALAIRMAQALNGEIISADSMQIYKGMDIATAKPTSDERAAAFHHLIDFLPQDSAFSVADFVILASKAVQDITSRGRLPIIAGGTGLYIDTFIDNITLPKETGDLQYREYLQKTAALNGNSTVLEMLRQIDPDQAEKLHENNLNRIIRSLEIYKTTGITMTEHIKNSRAVESPYQAVYFGINYERSVLYERIDRRVDEMLECGLLEETVDFYNRYSSKTAASAIGYKELKPYLDGEISLSDAVKNLKRATRNYAKRQMTWFKRNERIIWLDPAAYKDFDSMAEYALSKARDFLKDS